ncbi:MAG: hypothetical protein N2651_02045, partial [Fimbriimonadales bacterium]|nr:hypothetical protein [Fimbriimonadales bacterium]
MGWLMLIALLMVATAHSATITWTGAGSNNLFTNPNNWDLGRAPGSGDDVRIPNVGSHAEVVVDGGGFLNSLQSNLPLRVVGAYSLSTNTTFARDVVIEGGFVEMIPGTNVSFTTLTIQNGGTLRLNANCTATITGLFTFESGFLDGNGTTNANGGITLNAIGSGLKRIRDNHVLNVSGIATWTGGPLSIEGSGVFNLQGGATLNIQTDAEFAGGTFNNNGIVTKASGSSVTEFNTVFN